MSRILGLNSGTNSIGWAIIDDETNKLLNFGVRIFKNPSKLKTTKKKKHSTAIASLNTITGYSAAKVATIPTQSTPPIPLQSTPRFRCKGRHLFRSKVRHFTPDLILLMD